MFDTQRRAMYIQIAVPVMPHSHQGGPQIVIRGFRSYWLRYPSVLSGSQVTCNGPLIFLPLGERVYNATGPTFQGFGFVVNCSHLSSGCFEEVQILLYPSDWGAQHSIFPVDISVSVLRPGCMNHDCINIWVNIWGRRILSCRNLHPCVSFLIIS